MLSSEKSGGRGLGKWAEKKEQLAPLLGEVSHAERIFSIRIHSLRFPSSPRNDVTIWGGGDEHGGEGWRKFMTVQRKYYFLFTSGQQQQRQEVVT